MMTPILISCFVFAILLGLGVRCLRILFVAVTVQQESMSPTLHQGDRVLVLRKWPQRWLRKGQIVIVWPMKRPPDGLGPFGVEHPFIKRIVALPGDMVITSLKDLDPYNRVREYAAHNQQGNRTWNIPLGHCFVRGDHPIGGYDSLSWGPIPMECVLGLVVRRLTHGTSPPAQSSSRWTEPAVGRAAPPFTAETLNGDHITLDSFAGQIVVFLFVSPDCTPCQGVVALAAAVSAQAANAGVAVVLVSMAEAAQTQVFINDHAIQRSVLVAPRERNRWVHDYNITEFPFFCVINKDGIVQSTGLPFPATSAWQDVLKMWQMEGVGDIRPTTIA